MSSSTRKNVEDIYPLSPLQQGMLFHALYQPELGAYAEAFPLVLEGRLDADVLERAYRGLVERHPVLRTGFVWEGVPQPLQVVFRRAEPEFTRLDWSGLPEPEWRAKADELLAADRRRGYDLRRPPLLRATLARLADERHLFVWAYHHVLYDGWSLALLQGELDALYRAETAGRPARLPPAPRFRDYIAWLAKQDAAGLETFWRAALAGFREPTPLPLDKGGAGVPEEQAMQTLEVGREATARLQAFARECGVTLNTLVQAAWALVLARHSGRDDVVFGATLSGRPAELPGVERTVGLFINTLPTRVRLPAGARVGAWLAGVQHAAADVRQHEHARLVDVQGWSEVPGDRHLFDSILVFENYPVGTADDGHDEDGLRYEGLQVPERSTYAMTFVVVPGETIDLRLTYDTRRFSREAVLRVLAGTVAALEDLARGEHRPLDDLSPLTEDDRRALAGWSRSPAPDAPRAPFHRLFEEVAARRPDAPAIRFEGETIGYAQLNARANRLARRLRALGVGLETVVAASLERSPELVAAFLAIDKAGGAFLPVDPRYPAERRRWMLEDSGARFVLTHSSLTADLPQTGATVIALDEITGELDRESDANLPVEVDPENAAYVIFTSGSTGRPKGVVVPHRGIGNLAEAQHRAFGIGPESRVLQFASFSFDAAVAEVTNALLGGACLVMGTADALLPGPGLLDLLRREAVTEATLPPSVLAALPETDLPALTTVVSAGEAVSGEVVRRWGAGRRFVNGYGPTENTVAATLAADPAPEARPTIGRPIPGATAHVLDAAMREVPPGAPGELCVGGVGVARGYLGRPGLTAERFVPDPFSSEPGARLYRTGDRVRWRLDGQLDFLGRVDAQVKVRGFRIEPGEIEAALREHPAVQGAVAIAREDAPGDTRLVGYVVPADGAAPAAEELHAHLAARLPEHMVPGAFVALDAFPLTPSGKVDRRALPAPGRSGSQDGRAPSTPTEEALAALWRELLQVERVSADDSFFLLGGHSLLAMRLVSAVLERCEVELPLRAVFEAPRLADLAARIDAARDEALAALMEGLSEEELRALMEA